MGGGFGLNQENIKKSFKEFDLEKGKKTGVYENNSENRKKGRVGQKYSKDKEEKTKLAPHEKKFLQSVIRDAFDDGSVYAKKDQMVSIAKKIGLGKDFIDEMESDIKFG